MSSFSLYGSLSNGGCGLVKLIPAERYTTFSILHYYQQRHISWTPVFVVDDNIRTAHGYEIPECWKEISALNLAEQTKPPTNYTVEINEESIPFIRQKQL